jgi:hypothetical protein
MDLITQVTWAELLSDDLQIENVVTGRKLALHDDKTAVGWTRSEMEILGDHYLAMAGCVLKLLLIRDALTRTTGFMCGDRFDASISERGRHGGTVIDVLVKVVAEATHRS